nr:GNAT family N-acetyltransferase [uncultured Duganella sp.]
MSHMVDPHEGLLSFQLAYKAGEISPRACSIHRDLLVMMDDAEGTTRLTYALIDLNRKVKAIVVYLPVDPKDGKHCFQVGYAVSVPLRNKGIASEALQKSIDEMRRGFIPHMGEFYVEAVIGEHNTASLKVASNIISPTPSKIVDEASGEPALQFFRLIK